AHLSGLVRLQSGSFSVDESVGLDTLLDDSDWQNYIISPAHALQDWNAIQLTDEQVQEIQLGRFIPKQDENKDMLVMAYMPDGHLLAVLANRVDHWTPHKVFLPQ